MSTHSKKSSRATTLGFTLVEIMIVIAIIGLLALMAMPHYRRVRDYSQQNVCISNLRIISFAKAQYAIEGRRSNGDPVVEANIDPYLRKPFVEIEEPAGFAYQILTVGVDPACTQGAPHEL